MKIFIHGGCVSRDIFNYPEAKQFEVVSYHTRSHIQSGLCQKAINSDAYKNLNSPFQQKQIKGDFEKTFRADLLGQQFDILLMDFNGERNPLFVFNDGSRCTISKWLSDTGFVKEQLHSECGLRVKPFSDDMFCMWESAWIELISILKVINSVDKIRIIKNYWAHRTNDHSGFAGIYTSEHIEMANNYFDRIYDRISMDVSSGQFISPTRDLEIASAQHRWGKTPFHYIDEYYLSLLAELKSTGNLNS